VEAARFSITAWPRGTASGKLRAARDALQLGEIAQIAPGNCGRQAPLRFVQLPFNLAMTEALDAWKSNRCAGIIDGDGSSQRTGHHAESPALRCCKASSQESPKFWSPKRFGLENDAERALQFARSSRELRPRCGMFLAWNTVEIANARLWAWLRHGEEFGKTFSPRAKALKKKIHTSSRRTQGSRSQKRKSNHKH